MGRTKNEIFEEYIRILAQDFDTPIPMTPEQYEALQRGEYASSGPETEWSPDQSEEPKEKQEYRYNPEEKVYRGPRREDDPLKGRYSKKPKDKEPEANPSSGESEWQVESPKDSGAPDILDTIKSDPIHATVELKLHRSPDADFNTVYVLAESLHKWLKGSGFDPEPGTLLYNEIKYMLKFLNDKVEEKEKSIKS